MISGFDVDYSGSVASGDRGKVNSIGLAVSARSGRKTVRGGYDNGGGFLGDRSRADTMIAFRLP
jgi:hypothetical protein